MDSKPKSVDSPLSPHPGKENIARSPVTDARSPIRPAASDALPARKPRLRPATPASAPLQAQQSDPGPPQVAMATSSQDALEYLRQRLSEIAQEFADGILNRAQFHAIYNRYSEQRRIIEALIARNPDSDAWQQVALTGHTSFLRQHFKARVRFFALFALGSTTPIIHYGKQPPSAQEILPILKGLPAILKKRGTLKPASKALRNGQWLSVVPGQYTVSIVVYSLEPSIEQVGQIADLHSDFERANVHSLLNGEYITQRLVFPQRAMFET